MAKIFKRLKAGAMTYVIIDTPIFSCIQWLYLATIFGRQNINLIQDPNDAIINGKINLLPTCFIDRHKINSDLFISTWALSESSKYSQDIAIKDNFFNAEHFLIAWHDNNSFFPDSERILGPIIRLGAVTEDIEFLPKNHYAFH